MDNNKFAPGADPNDCWPTLKLGITEHKVFVGLILVGFMVIGALFGGTVGAVLEWNDPELGFDEWYADQNPDYQGTNPQADLGEEYDAQLEDYQLVDIDPIKKLEQAMTGTKAICGTLVGALGGLVFGFLFAKSNHDYVMRENCVDFDNKNNQETSSKILKLLAVDWGCNTTIKGTDIELGTEEEHWNGLRNNYKTITKKQAKMIKCDFDLRGETLDLEEYFDKKKRYGAGIKGWKRSLLAWLFFSTILVTGVVSALTFSGIFSTQTGVTLMAVLGGVVTVISCCCSSTVRDWAECICTCLSKSRRRRRLCESDTKDDSPALLLTLGTIVVLLSLVFLYLRRRATTANDYRETLGEITVSLA